MLTKKDKDKKTLENDQAKSMKHKETQENDVKEHREGIEKDNKTCQNNIRVTIGFNKQFLDDFDNSITYFGYARSSAILEACIKFMSELEKKRMVIEKSKKMRYGQR